MLRVKNHLKYRLFDYESTPTIDGYQLGDVLYKDYDGESTPEIGVVIQTFDDGDVRTDMWGMSSDSEVRPATIQDIEKIRPSILEDL